MKPFLNLDLSLNTSQGNEDRIVDALSRIERMDDEATSTRQVFAHVIAQIDSNQVDSIEDNAYEMLQSVEHHKV